jgi:C-terminal processing protease CtpA/Prc
MRPATSILAALSLAACAGTAPDMPPPTELPPLPATALAEGEATLSPAALRDDLTALYEGLQSAHYDLYARQSKAAYDALHAEMLAGLDRPLKVSEAAIVFQRFAAFGNVAHARLDAPYEIWGRYRDAGGTAVPVYTRIRDGRIFVTESYAEGLAPGDEIVAIEGRPADYWRARLGRNVSADNDYIAATLMEQAIGFHLFTELGEVPSVAMTVQRDGERRDVEVEAINGDTLAARTEAQETRYFELDSGTRTARITDDGIAYIYPGPFYAIETPEQMWDPTAFHAFVDESFETFLAAGARAVVIDLRDNPGGDNSFSDHLVAWVADEPFSFASSFRVRSSPESQASNQARIDAYPPAADGPSGTFAKLYAETPHGETFPFEIPKAAPREGARFDGPVFALIDRYSYSNATNVAATLQDYGFAVLLGEETSDLPTTYGAMESFTLPRSGLTVGYPKALIIRPSGDLQARGVVPDIAIEQPLLARTDVMLEQALEIVRERLE